MFSRIPIFDILKTHQISEAKSLLSETQSLINQFNNELDDITIELSKRLDTDSWTYFFDHVTDGFISNTQIQAHIYDAYDLVEKSIKQVNEIIESLKSK